MKKDELRNLIDAHLCENLDAEVSKNFQTTLLKTLKPENCIWK